MGFGDFIRGLLSGRLRDGFHVNILKIRFGDGKGRIVERAVWEKKKDKGG